MRAFFRRKSLRLCLYLCLALTILAATLDSRLAVRRYTVRDARFSAPVRLLLITDLHACRYGSDQQTLLRAIEQAAPDLILLGGDFFDDRLPSAPAETLLAALQGRWPCWYVTGNHEYWSGQADHFLQLLRDYGVEVLQGESCVLTFHGQTFNLCGIDDPEALRYAEGAQPVSEQLQQAARIRANGNYTILLAHRPELIDAYAANGFDLVLSGHAHGGQWRLPGLLNGLYAPDQGIFPKYAGGRYTVGQTTLIVSRGLARETTVIPRIFNRPELVIVDLLPAEA